MANKFKTFKCYQHFSDNLEVEVKNLDDRKILINLLMEGSGSEQEQHYAEIYYNNHFKKPDKLKEPKQLNLIGDL